MWAGRRRQASRQAAEWTGSQAGNRQASVQTGAMRRIIAAKKGASLPRINRRYVALKLIGRGSFGVVYLVRRQADSRQCVMKLIDMASMSDKDKSEATNECDVLQRLRRHPHIIRILEHFSDEEGKLCIVMDFADGGALRAPCLSAWLPVWLPVCLPVYLPVPACQYLHACLPACLPACLST